MLVGLATGPVNCSHLIKEMPAKFLHCKTTIFPVIPREKYHEVFCGVFCLFQPNTLFIIIIALNTEILPILACASLVY